MSPVSNGSHGGPLPEVLGIVGLGLMGASLAKGVRRAAPRVRIVAVEPRAETRERAVRERVVDEAHAAPGPALGACSLAVLCTPIAAIEDALAPVSRLLPDGAVLSDVGGAKERLAELARERVRPGVAFAGAHPLFGGGGGYAGADGDRWIGGTVAVTTDGGPEATERVAALHLALGARVERCTAAAHDAAIALVAHLPHLLAAALVEALGEAGPLAAALAGPGLKDATRLAQFPFDLQGELARRNRHLPEAAASVSRQLERIVNAVRASPEAARDALEAARAAREAMP